MSVVIELGPHTRKLLREIMGSNEIDIAGITKGLMESWMGMTPEERRDIETEWEKNLRREFKEPPETPGPEPADADTCRVCGCTTFTPCPGGCHWTEPDLCSKCAPKPPKPRLKTPKELFTEPERTEAPGESKVSRFELETASKKEKALSDIAAAAAEEIAVKTEAAMPSCECGCGQPVKKPSNRFLHGHGGGRRKKEPPSRSIKLTKHDIIIIDEFVKCPREDKLTDVDLCGKCVDEITRVHDKKAGQHFVRCRRADVSGRD